MRRHAWLSMFVAAALGGCMQIADGSEQDEPAVALASEELQLHPGGTLMPTLIEVCFASPGTLLGPRSDSCPINGALQSTKVNWLIGALQMSWQVNSAIDFVFHASCPAPRAGLVRINLFDSYVRVDANKNPVRDALGNAVCDPINQWGQIGGGAHYLGADLNMSICQSGVSCDNERERIQALVIHEMGHVLGFTHEHQRLDAPYLTSYTSPTQYTQAFPNICPAPARTESGFHNYEPVSGWELTAFDARSIMSYCRDWNGNGVNDVGEASISGIDLDRLSGRDIDGVQAAYGFPHQQQQVPPINCGSGAVMHVADFTGDGISDYLCKSTARIWARNGASTATFTRNTAWCAGSSEYMLIGDVSGDGRADLVCATATGLQADYASSTFSTLFTNVDATNAAWVNAPNLKYFLGSFDNAGPLEVVRLDTAARTLNVDFVTHIFDWMNAVPSTVPCLLNTNARLAIGDVTGDRIDDVICANPTNGNWYAFVTNALGHWNFASPLVLPPWLHNSTMIVDVSTRGDFDGDGKVDFVYPLSNGLAMRFGRSFMAPRAEPAWSTTTSDWSGPIGNVFRSSTMRIATGRVNNDARSDLFLYRRDYTQLTTITMPSTFQAP